jgi:DNA recombination protein RmuC
MACRTARARLKDVETRKQVDVIKDALGRLAVEFSRFTSACASFAEHIGGRDDAQKIQTTARRSAASSSIESANWRIKPAPANVVRLAEERKPGG